MHVETCVFNSYFGDTIYLGYKNQNEGATFILTCLYKLLVEYVHALKHILSHTAPTVTQLCIQDVHKKKDINVYSLSLILTKDLIFYL